MEGRSRRRTGCGVPTKPERDWTPFPFIGAKPETPFTELVSPEDVPALPLRFRFLNFAIASASRSRMRVAMGERTDAGLKGDTVDTLLEDPEVEGWFDGTVAMFDDECPKLCGIGTRANDPVDE